MPQKAKRLDPKSYSSPGKSEITFSHCFVLQLTVAIKLRLLYPLSYPFLIWERIRTSDTSCSQRPFRNAVDLKSRRTAQAKTCSQKHRMQIHASPMRENGPSISNRHLPEDTTKKTTHLHLNTFRKNRQTFPAEGRRAAPIRGGGSCPQPAQPPGSSRTPSSHIAPLNILTLSPPQSSAASSPASPNHSDLPSPHQYPYKQTGFPPPHPVYSFSQESHPDPSDPPSPLHS